MLPFIFFVLTSFMGALHCFEVLPNGAVRSSVVGGEIAAREDKAQLFEIPSNVDPLYEQDTDIVHSGVEDYRNAQSDSSYIWDSKEIPYVLDKTLSTQALELIHRAIGDFDKYTCLKWRKRTAEDRDFVKFTDNYGCYSAVGRVGGEQEVSIGQRCAPKGIVLHEMMHTIGFFHEHNRPDRDEYVKVNWRNIENGKLQNFCVNDGTYCEFNDLYMPEGLMFNARYDYGSLMHYDEMSFAKQATLRTMEPKVDGILMGQRIGFSDYDIVKIAKLYDCPKNTTRSPMREPFTTASTSTSTTSTITSTTTTDTTTTISANATTDAWWQGCRDYHPRCEDWKKQGACEKYPGGVLNLCRQSCNNCNGSNCYDTTDEVLRERHCVEQAQNNFGVCTGKVHTILCPKSCGLCSEEFGWQDP